MRKTSTPKPQTLEPLAQAPVSLPGPSSVPHVGPTGPIKSDGRWHLLKRKRRRAGAPVNNPHG